MKKKKKRIAIIGTVGVPAKYGGFETLAENLIKNLDDEYDITVYCSGKKYKKMQRLKYYQNARLKYLPLNPNGVCSLPYDTLSIIHSLAYADILLILGIAGAWILPFVKIFSRKRIIVSIDGIEWKSDKLNFFMKCYMFWAEKKAIKYSHIDISDNESIQDYTAMRYGSVSRVIEYGGDHTIMVKPGQKDKQEYPFLNGQYAFNVCNIEPDNNVHEILKAFSQLPKYTLVMVGDWNDSKYGIRLREQYGKYSNIHLLDPIYEQRRLDLLRGNALVYIHGHSGGGTNPSLVEAMSLGLPVIAYRVSYNRTTTDDKASYFKDHNDLKEIIKNITIPELKEIGENMKSIAQRRYTWAHISEKYKALLAEALTIKSKDSITPKSTEIETSKLLDMGIAHLKNQQQFYEKR
ncbi:MAG: glycosyl transferase [Bacteroidetes bacterium 4484_276]|nr:MAG: glycosyl transferase [Bacteroidetes bacterium 4484_276]